MKTSEIRRLFTEYFLKNGHVKKSSSELVPINDSTLLFVNSGMVQFKEYFTGKAQAQDKRVVTIQKCVRAGGKHNDLENVGFTARHHTFFEMLGNFSFGDYFKEEAIKMAWEFLTEVLKIPKSRLYVTAHHSDTEAADIWLKTVGVDPKHFFFRGDKDNFWEMGEVGPCGPSSEIFFDHGPEYTDHEAKIKECLLDDESRYVEIWNLVFMQYEKYYQDEKILRRPLPNPCIDTGAGLERMAAVLQGQYNNFDTDAFQGIIKCLEQITKKNYSEKNLATSFRVVADHIRAATMLITDGVIPSNEGRGYVLRRIIRRAVRHLNLLDVNTPTLHLLADEVFKGLGEEYPENARNYDMAVKFLKNEEESFRKTLSSGLQLLDREKARLQKEGKKTLEGEVIFKLYDTHGFPLDLIELILKENQMELDIRGFEQLMEEQKQRSRQLNAFASKEDNLQLFYSVKEKHGSSEFVGYTSTQVEAKLLEIIDIDSDCFALIFNKTPFYGESGGQVGDRGWIKTNSATIEVQDTLKPIEGLHAHMVSDKSKLVAGQIYNLVVDNCHRQLIAKNHTATHLLHSSLRQVLGSHVKQAGSLVTAQRLRFDFSHPEAVTQGQLAEVELLVNKQIFLQIPVCPQEMSKDNAIKKGAMALFGEKYGNTVRVLEIGSFSIELCGGTHVGNTGDIHLFKIVSESALSAGVRRIEAVTSLEALKDLNNRSTQLSHIEEVLHTNCEKVVERVEQIQLSIKEKDKEIKSLKEKLQANQAKQLFDDPQPLGNGIAFKVIYAPEASDIRQIGDMFIEKYKEGTVLILAPKEGRSSILLKTFKGNKKFNCSDILKETLGPLGGSGGGKPDMAQGSISHDKLKDAENKIRQHITSL